MTLLKPRLLLVTDDTALARTRIHDEGKDPDDPVIVLKPRHRVEGDEAEHLALVLGDKHLRVG